MLEGAGHGGRGGRGSGVTNTGYPYGSLFVPDDRGCKGGDGHGTGTGGLGGGIIKLKINNLQNDGTVSAIGQNGKSNGGGGSGGAVYVEIGNNIKVCCFLGIVMFYNDSHRRYPFIML